MHINAHCRIKGVFDNLENSCINWVKIGKQEPGTPFSKQLDPHLMQRAIFTKKSLDYH